MEESGQTRTKEILWAQQSSKMKLHTNNNPNSYCGKTAHELTHAAKLSFSSFSLWMDPNQCVHHRLVQEIENLNAILLFPPHKHPSLSLVLRRLWDHRGGDVCVSSRDHSRDGWLISCTGQQTSIRPFQPSPEEEMIGLHGHLFLLFTRFAKKLLISQLKIVVYSFHSGFYIKRSGLQNFCCLL